MTEDAALIDVRDVRKSFRSPHGVVHAVAGISLTVKPGEIVAFLGPNGAGKTTTIDMILGLTEPTSGQITIAGKPPREAVAAGRISAVLQTGGLLRDLTVGETLRAVAALHRAPKRVAEVARLSRLESLLDRKVSKCSGGEQQRVKFALAMLSDPDVLVLDEPTAGMDVTARREFWHTMRADAHEGRTIIFATHYLEEAEAFSQRTILVAQGEIVADAPTAQLRAIASGREVWATLPAELDPSSTIKELESRTDVAYGDYNGQRIHITTGASDALAKYLLNELSATDLEISAPSLESAFINLTSKQRSNAS